MFTGIVEEIGNVKRVQTGAHSAVLTIAAERVLEDARIGDSIAVNGVCLTVTAIGAGCFAADVMHETLNRSSLGGLRAGDGVNLERALAANGRFGGHIVAGHVDGMGRITEIRKDDTAVWFRIAPPSALLRYIVEKGSITVDGISLTVAAVSEQDFSVSVIPHSAAVTTLGVRRTGDRVNLETDLIGKYVEKLLLPAAEKKSGGITQDFLTKYGY